MALALRAIDRLKQAADRRLKKRTVTLSNGTEFEFWTTRLTMAERERAQKDAKTDDATAFALQLLVNKAKDKDGQRMFLPADMAELKHECDDADIQALMLALLQSDEEEEEPIDMKSPRKGAEE